MAEYSFSGGDKMNARLAEIAAKIGKAGSVRVGFLEGATYPDGTSVPMVAAIQEFGAPAKNIPPRPFFRNMISKESPQWGDILADQLVSTDYDADLSLSRMGEEIAGELRQSITDTNSPVLSPRTIAAKGFDKPLVDAGHMQSSISFEVKP